MGRGRAINDKACSMINLRDRAHNILAAFIFTAMFFGDPWSGASITQSSTNDATSQQASPAQNAEPHTLEKCRNAIMSGVRGRPIALVVCHFPSGSDIRLFLNDPAGAPFGYFDNVNTHLAKQGETLAFAMNAGMYHQDRSAVGLYIENGTEASKVNTNNGPGNFHLKPNGVFFIQDDGKAGVRDTETFLQSDQTRIRFATQSGPMLVIDGQLHPRFLVDATSRKRRNGVGVTERGEIYFVLASSPVTFFEFGKYFRDQLNIPNALFLDGSISKIFSPALDRNDRGPAMGPIVGVVVGDHLPGDH